VLVDEQQALIATQVHYSEMSNIDLRLTVETNDYVCYYEYMYIFQVTI
jgi:hypothetical protein